MKENIDIDKYCTCGFGQELHNFELQKEVCAICWKEIMPPEVKKRLCAEEAEEVNSIQKEEKKDSILIVDDQDFFRKILTDMLTSKGYIVNQASNGLEAIEYISRFINIEDVSSTNTPTAPRIVILDLNMPGLLNGIQTLGVLKTIKKDIKVIILTSTPPQKDLLSTLGKLGAKKYINKKAQNLEELLIQNITSLKK